MNSHTVHPSPNHYLQPRGDGHDPLCLVALDGDEEHTRYVFYDHLEVGRYQASRKDRPGLLLIEDPTVSSRHCVITRDTDGACHIRDLSRNGVRLDGRRLVHDHETPLQVGQVLQLGIRTCFRLAAPKEAIARSASGGEDSTVLRQDWGMVTVLVGDIRHYTPLTHQTLAMDVIHSVHNVFTVLGREVERLGGTVKEFQGDAMLAFWEAGKGRADPVIQACRAAVILSKQVRDLAEDPAVWSVGAMTLEMDWALATGLVAMEGGSNHAGGLMMVGEPVVRAFRMEKLAGPHTGSILVCEATRSLAGPGMIFDDLGSHRLDGFDEPEHVYALRSLGEEPA